VQHKKSGQLLAAATDEYAGSRWLHDSEPAG
jgi:hypothetical protein